MTAPTVAVTVKLAAMTGTAYEGVTVRARLDRNDSYQSFVISDDVTGVTDAAGSVVLNLFPNNPTTGLGITGSVYHITASIPGGRRLSVTAQIPNSACNLHDVYNQDEVAGVTAAEAAQASAQASATAAAASAAEAAATAAGVADISAEVATVQASEAAAAASETAAAASASAASTSETNAAASATAASGSAGTASTQATNAAASATAASGSASTASTQATNAASSATSASTSAATATTQAGNASTSATGAATSATNASASATTATTQAGIATTQAGNAATSATGASTSATNAASSATAAAASVAAIPQNSKSANYTTVLADAGNSIYHPPADTTARTWTIDSNANVAYPVGTAITFDNDFGAGAITVAITSDTLVLVGPTGSTGSRTLASGGQATAIKVTSTRWRINGTGLT